MNPQLHFLLSVAALAVALMALVVSMMNAFPGLKTAFAVARDGVLWLALFFVLGGVGFIVWQRAQQLPTAAHGSAQAERHDITATFVPR